MIDPHDYPDTAAGWQAYTADRDAAERKAAAGIKMCPCDGTLNDPCNCGYVQYHTERNAAEARGETLPTFGAWREANGYARTEDEMTLAVLLDEREALKQSVESEQARLRENREQIPALRAKMASEATAAAPANTKPYPRCVEFGHFADESDRGVHSDNDFLHDAVSNATSDISQRIAEQLAKFASTTWHANAASPPRPRFYDHLDRMKAIHDSKNADYADSAVDPFRNFRQSEIVAVPPHVGAFIRLGDKYMRIANLLRREQESGNGAVVTDESVEDTLIDLANYALIVLTLHEQYRESAK